MFAFINLRENNKILNKLEVVLPPSDTTLDIIAANREVVRISGKISPVPPPQSQ